MGTDEGAIPAKLSENIPATVTAGFAKLVELPTVSHHLKVLVDAGLLRREQRGKWAYFRLVDGALDSAAEAIASIRR
jgi:DNA-binding transcriptional ArsR family regulator